MIVHEWNDVDSQFYYLKKLEEQSMKIMIIIERIRAKLILNRISTHYMVIDQQGYHVVCS